MRSYFMLSLFLLLLLSAHGKKYYTLTSGSWNNTTSVWSLNNSTPCGCFPGYSVSLDTLTINHPLNLTGTVNSSASGRIRINPNGSLNSTTSDLMINNSIVLSYGAVSIRSLNVGTGGLFSIQNASLVINLNYDNYGTTILDHAAIHQMNGNVNVFPGSLLQLTNGSYFQSITGNIKNEGVIQVCPTCCLELMKGNITNQPGSLFQGNGAVNLSNGTIKNYGLWDPNLAYCSSGNDVGLTSAENCILSKQICLVTNTGLPSELIHFEGSNQNNYNFLEWQTAGESFQDYYQLDHSTNGQDWNMLVQIPANAEQEATANYNFIDSIPMSFITYYRLTKFDENNLQLFSSQLSIKSEETPSVTIFPNPTDKDVVVKCHRPNEFNTLELRDSNGKSLFFNEVNSDGITKVTLPDEAGVYYLQLHGSSRTTVFSIIKY